MTDKISRRRLFTLGLAAGTALALAQPTLARGGPDPEDRLTAQQRRALEKERQNARAKARRKAEEERRKIKR